MLFIECLQSKLCSKFFFMKQLCSKSDLSYLCDKLEITCNCLLICFVKYNLVKIWTHMVFEFTKYVICVKVAFTRYLKKHPYSTLSASGSLRIWHISIHICNRSNPYLHLYLSLSMFESESDRKCENKYNIGDRYPSASDLFTSRPSWNSPIRRPTSAPAYRCLLRWLVS